MNVYTIRNTARNVTIQTRTIGFIKIKNIALSYILGEAYPFCNRCKYEIGVSVMFYPLLWWINLIYHAFKIRLVNIQKLIEGPGSRIKYIDNVSLIVMVVMVK